MRKQDVGRLVPERAFRRLELQIVRRLDGLLHGEHLGLVPGQGSELAEARAYRPGEDDIRHMDWSVTARTTVPHVRDLVTDHELETWALVDLSASMDFGTGLLEKRDLAVAAVAAVGFLTARTGDRFGAYVLHGGDVRRWPARSGRPALYGLLQSLLDRPRTPAGAAEPRLAEAINGLSRRHPKRGLRVVVSDFLDVAPAAVSAPEWEQPMRRLATRHQVLAVEVIDAREMELPDVGTLVLTDPETGQTREVDTGRRGLRERYAAAAAEQRAATRAALRRCGAAHLVLRTDRDWVADIARFAMAQRRLTRQNRSPLGAGGPGAGG